MRDRRQTLIRIPSHQPSPHCLSSAPRRRSRPRPRPNGTALLGRASNASPTFDPAYAFVSSPLLSPSALAAVRLLLALYALCTICTALALDLDVAAGSGRSFLSFLTQLSYIGVAAYLVAAGAQTVDYARWEGRGIRCGCGGGECIWCISLPPSSFLLTLTFVAGSLVQHLPPRAQQRLRAPRAPPYQLPVQILLLAGYLGVAYVTKASQVFTVCVLVLFLPSPFPLFFPFRSAARGTLHLVVVAPRAFRFAASYFRPPRLSYFLPSCPFHLLPPSRLRAPALNRLRCAGPRGVVTDDPRRSGAAASQCALREAPVLRPSMSTGRLRSCDPSCARVHTAWAPAFLRALRSGCAAGGPTSPAPSHPLRNDIFTARRGAVCVRHVAALWDMDRHPRCRRWRGPRAAREVPHVERKQARR
ncbi:hypothetical protein FB451DRAFT_1418348 [Mycena latifolia]|nr:hypothetical protein FB451DRAFT_1418348 [Mycena latifolia]